MSRWAWSLSLLAALTAVAHAEGKSHTLAMYAPNAPFESGADRFGFANKVASALSSATGAEFQAKVYAKAADLEAAIKNKQVDLAIVDGIYLAERGVPYPVLATATIGGDTSTRWWLFGNGAGSVQDLQGKVLSVSTTGARDTAFLENALLDGELQIARFFSNRVNTPDISSAVAAVALKKADAVFAPEAAGKGLKKVFDAGKVANPAMCDLGGLPPELLAKVKAALPSATGGGVFDGWKAGSEAQRALAGKMGARARRPVMVEPELVRIEDPDLLIAPVMEPSLSDLKSQFWMPTAQ